jgi:hypothetical protein
VFNNARARVKLQMVFQELVLQKKYEHTFMYLGKYTCFIQNEKIYLIFLGKIILKAI